MRTFALAFAFVVTLASSAVAGTWQTKGGYPACISEALFNEAMIAARNNDQAHFLALKGCIITKPGIPVGLVERGAGYAKVRILSPDAQHLVIYTNPSNIVPR